MGWRECWYFIFTHFRTPTTQDPLPCLLDMSSLSKLVPLTKKLTTSIESLDLQDRANGSQKEGGNFLPTTSKCVWRISSYDKGVTLEISLICTEIFFPSFALASYFHTGDLYKSYGNMSCCVWLTLPSLFSCQHRECCTSWIFNGFLVIFWSPLTVS